MKKLNATKKSEFHNATQDSKAWKTREAKKNLASYGITHNLWVRIRPWLMGAVLVAVIVSLSFWLMEPSVTSNGSIAPEQSKRKDFLQIIILIAGFFFGYVQWIMARYEASLERFYERLDVANRGLGTMVEQAWSRAKPDDFKFDVYDNPPRMGVSLFDMWIFAELDNLEYIMEKYRWGFITALQACRAVETFKSRCKHDPEFTRRALRFSLSAGYHKTSRGVVEKIKNELGQ